jgi:hypothetical protein
MRQGRSRRTPILATALLATAAVVPAARAFDWPWQETHPVQYSYCKGFVVAALGALPVESLSRTQLWLAWNAINRDGIPPATPANDEYSRGRDHFDQLLAGGDLAALRQVADEDCALGRN